MYKEFEEAYKRYREYIGISKYPISYKDWKNLPRDQQAIALYVNYYSLVTLAWNKALQRHKNNRDESTAVSYLSDRLDRVVPLILVDENKFSAAYMYTTFLTTLCCVTRALRNHTVAFHTFNVTTNFIDSNTSNTVDWYEYISKSDIANIDFVENMDQIILKEMLWKELDSEDDKFKKIANNLMGGTSKQMPKSLDEKTRQKLINFAEKYVELLKDA